MKKLFGNSKSRTAKASPKDGILGPVDEPISTPIYQQHAVTSSQSQPSPLPPPVRNTAIDDDRRDHPSPYAAPLGSPNMPSSPSPYQTSQASLLPSNKPLRDRDAQSLRKSPAPNPPIVSNILRALEPPSADAIPYPNRSVSEDGFSTVEMPVRDPRDHTEKREKKSFWTWERHKDHDKDRDRSNRDRGRDVYRGGDENTGELIRMIGFLTATSSEDWALVLDVCDRVSANENNAREAVKALRKEFKYGEPAGQLSAARLWAIMLRNCSEVFASQSMNRKFLETIEELLMNPKTSPVVRERLLDVIAAAAYASGAKKDARNEREGFRGLWRRVKPFDKPDEGMPFAMDDAMFNPPVGSRNSHYDFPPALTPEPVFTATETVPVSPPPPTPVNQPRPQRKRKSPTRNRIIPHDEDVRRLLQECKIAQGNANVLSQALFHAKPESFKKDPVVREFYRKCRSSQELIYAQIPWATAEAEKSMMAKDDQQPTKEQELLDAILAANGDLLEVLNQYEDMDRVAMERKAEYRSRKETRLERKDRQELLEQQNRNSLQYPPPSRSPSPSIHSSSPHQSLESRRLYPDGNSNTLLAPPPLVPHGPRSPGQFSVHSRTPPPQTMLSDSREVNGAHTADAPTVHDSSYDDVDVPIQPSAKALGKQRALEADSADTYSQYGRDSAYFDSPPNKRNSHTFDDSDDEEHHQELPWHRPVQYVYDAAAELTAARLREEHEQQQQAVLVNGVY
ncbi:hypothetical protein D9756_008105 [Leucocoprinus leucothites]|uniref:VHS domain-containing protein n=1 Tax=Leucocoprinus leucothites TaxID=201217 RepID=A0A8H5D674_9AGAR|nr:hypothetical protein D9756_008105 [Leucoagaricus leucothites]